MIDFIISQRKLQDTRAQLQTVERQGMAYANEMRRAGLVAAELQDLPEDTSVYRSVGKAFLSTSRNAALTEVEESRAEASKRIESLKVRSGFTCLENMLHLIRTSW